MRALLDTQAFLWWITDSALLSAHAREVIADSGSELFFSAASAWEIAIKAQRGRLQLPDRPGRFIPEQLSLNAFDPLPVELSHALQVYHLPDHHRDPFDRLLVAQSQLEDLPILTADPRFSKYDVQVIW